MNWISFGKAICWMFIILFVCDFSLSYWINWTALDRQEKYGIRASTVSLNEFVLLGAAISAVALIFLFP